MVRPSSRHSAPEWLCWKLRVRSSPQRPIAQSRFNESGGEGRRYIHGRRRIHNKPPSAANTPIRSPNPQTSPEPEESL
ncbi:MULTISPECIES: hypothetical protein, partial [unclassified Limnospira]|uniref:hypothetical protein n=1 Tax=unclassified Limnospira TaxID=2642885 RepID=UPI0028E0A809|nr:hypothetical protein [Limnospira sp. PMC 289.06]MDT9298053.1 hypothetical protein [Arthrospira platensis PCC 7345]MDT9313493.1 hypothetical protein [Limnospira sp. Paracas R14]